MALGERGLLTPSLTRPPGITAGILGARRSPKPPRAPPALRGRPHGPREVRPPKPRLLRGSSLFGWIGRAQKKWGVFGRWSAAIGL